MSKRILFDIGVAGPLAGFAMLIVAAGGGLGDVEGRRPGSGRTANLVFGTPLILRLFEMIHFPGRAGGRYLSASGGARARGWACWPRR